MSLKKLINIFLLAFILFLVLYAKKIIGIIDVITGKSKKENTLDINNINQNLVKSENAIQGELSLIGEQMQKEIDEGKRHDFDKIVFCNIGNPQAVGQKPITFYRQVLSLLEHPELLDETNIESLYPKDVIERAREYLEKSKFGVGAYTNAQGFEFILDDVAEFIEKRDGYKSNTTNIFLTNGASEGIQMIFITIIRNKRDGILIPIPQYPLYSDTITLLGGTEIHYYLDESKGWGISMEEIKNNVKSARLRGINPRGLVVINPGNPTGQILEVENMKEIIEFCHKENIVLMADEVYQENVYAEGKKFISFRKVLYDMGEEYNDVQLISFHSVSKGFLGECGHRGGYFELVNINPEVTEQIYKLASARSCSNTLGQLMVSLMVRPPKEGGPSYDLFQEEKYNILNELKERSILLAEEFNNIPGLQCSVPQGAMYIFPSIDLPKKFIEEAKKLGKEPDFLWCKYMLEEAGIVLVPGSGFGQKPGTYHFRSTFLPDKDTLRGAAYRMKAVQEKILEEYS